MIGLLVAIVIACIVYFVLAAIGVPTILAIIAALLVLLVGFPVSGGYGLRRR
jgi:hypothetical protein